MIIELAAGILLDQPTQIPDRLDLVPAADRYCISAHGNHSRTSFRAREDGFAPLGPESVEGLRLPGPRYLRAWRRSEQGVDFQILTAVVRIQGFSQGENFFRICWVSASPWERPAVDQQIRRMLEVAPLRMNKAYLYAWATSPEGDRRRVGRREFTTTALRDALEQDIQFVMTTSTDRLVSIAYMVPTDSLEDPEAPQE